MGSEQMNELIKCTWLSRNRAQCGEGAETALLFEPLRQLLSSVLPILCFYWHFAFGERIGIKRILMTETESGKSMKNGPICISLFGHFPGSRKQWV